MIKEEPLSAMQLRKMNDVFDLLRHDPYTVRPIERYGERAGMLLSPRLWEVVEGIIKGHTRVFHLPIDHVPPQGEKVLTKMVVVRPGVSPQEHDVLVDWIPYTLRGTEPDYTQLLWRHHPDVARALTKAIMATGPLHMPTSQKNQED